MKANDHIHRIHVDQTYFLSEILGARAMLHGKKIGKLDDIIVRENEKFPEIISFLVTRPFGNPSLIVPWENVLALTKKEIVIDIPSLDRFVGEPGDEAVLLKDHILDKKVLDMEGKEVDVVYDVKIVLIGDRLYVSEVDFSRYGLLKRMGLKGFAHFIYSLADRIQDQTVSWKYIQPLPENLSSFRGEVRLNVLKEKLGDLRPVDVADILEELDQDQRMALFEQLEPDHASDTLEEIDPNVQRDIVEALDKQKVAQLIDVMTPAQAADVLSVLPWWEAKPILDLIDKEDAEKIETILTKQEERIENYATKNFLKVAPDMTVDQASNRYHLVAKSKDVVMYLYVVDETDKLLGVIDIKELLQARDEELMKDIMEDNVITLRPESTLKYASQQFARYDFRAIPVVDIDGKIVGVVPYRDVMRLTHHFVE